MRVIVILLLLSCSCAGRQLKHTEEYVPQPEDVWQSDYSYLSKDKLLKLKFQRYITTGGTDSCIIKLFFGDKSKNAIEDSISVTSDHLPHDIFMQFRNVMSYSTNFNTFREIVDNDYGEFIVADLNFDDKEDFAIINDQGGNGGIFYSYFTQTREGKFALDRFLTDSMTYFPTTINRADRTLLTRTHAGSCYLAEDVFELSAVNNEWRKKRSKLIDVCGKSGSSPSN